MWKQPGHLTSIKKLLGDWISRLSLCFIFSSACDGWNKSFGIFKSIQSDVYDNLSYDLNQIKFHNEEVVLEW